ncbi:thioredoxin-dependent thiol peroxidase [Gilliamella apicola]|jgi:Peroxiredoxin|uniref:thioredoxin-dependent thiol peroxidase n=1 Tax=Gilliamella apicola TaxID=1196095 RepID=UPI00080E7BB4|nr:thioredoxin-dependent thiol peroxidase [Gilliamella apicola]OCG12719.1 thioredoxin-dependent thiol peroxidase [Gilliamella apicola]ORF45369.1 thioredoxin-dependent thiol peroxidase [Gilliamella apicola]ORF47065.1 thioredoxin-dependent thiol peroxidase [Gilliamella apicola]ORF47739.1 thioredoxin-dependent thiol peroxidase [Gilliamella apicola]ORF53738.1 thioredoxin-dependent thiol peroxidase [Gilliamella apicola]
MVNPLKEGEKAPEFSLPDQDGEYISLKDFKGQRVLIYFYPKAMTPGCTVQACNLRDSSDDFKNYDVVILGISTDKPEKLSRFVEKELLNFTLLSDENHEVAQAFGTWGEKEFMGKTYEGIHRISFLISKDGNIEKVFDNFKTSDHHEVVLDYLKNQCK